VTLAEFVVTATPPAAARAGAARALLDTVGVTLAGASQPAARAVQRVIGADGVGPCRVLGTALRASPANAALANGTAAHALDYDDMCFVSLAHPSAGAAGQVLVWPKPPGRAGLAVLDAYVAASSWKTAGGAMNPRHYQRGWHCTSTIGTIGAAAAAARVLGLDAKAAGTCAGDRRIRSVATHEKPWDEGRRNAGARRNGVLAAQLAAAG
jgi:2-methylcitrate dehydratase PrpD